MIRRVTCLLALCLIFSVQAHPQKLISAAQARRYVQIHSYTFKPVGINEAWLSSAAMARIALFSPR